MVSMVRRFQTTVTVLENEIEPWKFLVYIAEREYAGGERGPAITEVGAGDERLPVFGY